MCVGAARSGVSRFLSICLSVCPSIPLCLNVLSVSAGMCVSGFRKMTRLAHKWTTVDCLCVKFMVCFPTKPCDT